MSPYKAVVFDLFGTLVDEDRAGYQGLIERMAKLLGTPPERIYEATAADALARNRGDYDSTEHQFEALCTMLGIQQGTAVVGSAIHEYLAFQESRVMHPRPGVVATLAELGTRGLLRGLVSNCSLAVAQIWAETPMAPHIDVPVLSAVEKLVKPDRTIFARAADRLMVAPSDCLYVGDGGSSELSGARSVGMTPVLIRVPYDDAPALGDERLDAADWSGLTVGSIPEVLRLL